MTGLNFKHISYFYRKFGPVIYQTCTGWIRYPDAGHIENSIFRLVYNVVASAQLWSETGSWIQVIKCMIEVD